MNVGDLSSNAKLLLNFLSDPNQSKTLEMLVIQSEMKEKETIKTLKELMDKEFVIKYKNKYMLILTDEQTTLMKSYHKKKLEKNLTHTVSFSRIDQLRKSRRKFFFKYVLRMYPQRERGGALTFGIFSHDLIEDTFELSLEEVKEFLSSRVQNMILEFPEDMQETLGIRLFELIPNLIAIKEKYEVIQLERRVETEIRDISNEPKLVEVFTALTPDKYKVGGKKVTKLGFVGYIDGWLVNRKTGKKTVADWKTGKHSVAKFRDYAKQIQVYAKVLRLLGEKPEVGVIVFIEEVDERGNFTGEYKVDISEATCDKVFNKMIDGYLKVMREGIEYKNFTKCCQTKFVGWCEYRRLCHLIDGTKMDMPLIRQQILTKLKVV